MKLPLFIKEEKKLIKLESLSSDDTTDCVTFLERKLEEDANQPPLKTCHYISSKEDYRYSFDLVSCQFAYHYSFSSKENVLSGLKNVSTCLKSKGKFILTIPDCDVIYSRLKKAPGCSFGNQIYQIKFDQKENFIKYGQKYCFNLADAIEECPEYLVHIDTLKRYNFSSKFHFDALDLQKMLD